ncbi:MAG: ATP-dependent DNA ligase [Salibacteraceae bacterium]
MRQFAQLFRRLDQTTKINLKVGALHEFFAEASDEDKLWAIALLAGKRPKRTVRTSLLREWGAEVANIPLWLFEDSYHVVGDLAETIANLHPQNHSTQQENLTYWITFIRNLDGKEDDEKKELILTTWDSMDASERFVFNKLITGGFRVGVSQKLKVRALARYTGLEENLLAHRLMGNWSQVDTSFNDLVLAENPDDNRSRPYPFYLAYSVEEAPENLGVPEEWQAERKWDGIRGQVIQRGGELFVWSRGEELVTDKFPEFEILRQLLPDGTVLDGEILPYKDGAPLAFNDLQTRIGRKNVTRNVLQKAPVVLVAYDLLEADGQDLRHQPMRYRREKLEQLVAEVKGKTDVLHLSEVLSFKDWSQLVAERARSREMHCEGLMLKRKDSIYEVGRKKGAWWKWKVDPLMIDAVMIYAMRGHGRRANLYTDYTFAVWDGEALVPFTKAYSGLTDKEIREVDAFVKKNTIDRFGPVRSVNPELVFEIAFEGINRSTRHKSGVALRFPRMNRWRLDKPAAEANTLSDLHQLLNEYGG